MYTGCPHRSQTTRLFSLRFYSNAPVGAAAASRKEHDSELFNYFIHTSRKSALFPDKLIFWNSLQITKSSVNFRPAAPAPFLQQCVPLSHTHLGQTCACPRRWNCNFRATTTLLQQRRHSTDRLLCKQIASL